MGELRSRKERAEALRQESWETQRRLQAITTAVDRLPAELTAWDEGVIHQLLEDIQPLKKNQYGSYLMDVLNGKYMEKLY